MFQICQKLRRGLFIMNVTFHLPRNEYCPGASGDRHGSNGPVKVYISGYAKLVVQCRPAGYPCGSGVKLQRNRFAVVVNHDDRGLSISHPGIDVLLLCRKKIDLRSPPQRLQLGAQPAQSLNVREHRLLIGSAARRVKGISRIAWESTWKVAAIVRVAAARHSYFVAVIEHRYSSDCHQECLSQL